MKTHISLDLIRQTLDRDFPGHILSRGYQYFQEERVREVEMAREAFRAEVRGSNDRVYIVKGELPFGKLRTNCTCPYGAHCKHEAAVLYHLRDTYASPFGTKNKPSITKNGSRSLPKLSAGTAGEFRKLPLEEVSLAEFLRQVGQMPHFPRGNNAFEGILKQDGSLLLRGKISYDYYRVRYHEIQLKRVGNSIYLRCAECNEASSQLCRHQASVLSMAAGTLEASGYLKPDFSVTHVLEMATRETGVSVGAFFDYYQLYFSLQGFTYRPRKENVFPPGWLRDVQRLRDSQDKKRQARKKVLEQQLLEGRSERLAFLWGTSPDDREERAPLRFMQGASLKTKEGIRSTDRHITELPEGFAPAQQALAQQLYFYFHDFQPDRDFTAIKELLEENIDTLNEVYQYVATSDELRASDLHLVQFHPGPLEARFEFSRVDGLICLRREVLKDRKPFDYREVQFSNGIFAATEAEAFLFPNAAFERFMALFPGEDRIFFPNSEGEMLMQLIEDLQQYFETRVEEGLLVTRQLLRHPEFQIRLRELGAFIVFEPRLDYGTHNLNAFQEETIWINGQPHEAEASDRAFLLEFLENAHPDFDRPRQWQDFVYLPINKMLDNYWFLHFNEACEAAGLVLLGQKELSKFNYSKHKAETFSNIRSGIDWFEVDMGVSFGSEQVKTVDWIRALRNQESYVRLQDGTLGILPEEWLAQARKVLAVSELEQGNLKISKYRFNIIEELFEDLDDEDLLQELRQKKQRLASLDLEQEYPLPKRLRANLRPYQRHGFTWLKFLEESGFGGILADDMGLGKTLQVLALLADQYNQPPSLIVVPRSLLFNWGAEIEKFCPDLSYTIHHGPTRARNMDTLLGYELIITTYGTATSDVTFLRSFDFNYIVLDESQAIKNPASKRYKAMRLLRSRNKITMTGTPIENNTFDLYAQLSFCSPGLLGSQTSFKKNFAIPIDRDRDREAAQLLRKLIHPFVLRRTKAQVAQELPDKTETVIYCEMGTSQRKLYENLKRKIKEDIDAELVKKGFQKSRFKILDGLLRLRQMCNSPLLLNQSFQEQKAQSVKIDVLLQHLTEELDHHSALVFSQFVGFLSLVRRELDQLGIPYAYLDGSTVKRQEEVERFMEDQEVQIFLISLKAGNTGLNLTKADYVYILDPWWNPAVEAQAIDRTHRIGQDKNIFAYKLICKDSIEEKILKLQERKKELSTDIIRTDEHAFKSLSRTELLDLFK